MGHRASPRPILLYSLSGSMNNSKKYIILFSLCVKSTIVSGNETEQEEFLKEINVIITPRQFKEVLL